MADEKGTQKRAAQLALAEEGRAGRLVAFEVTNGLGQQETVRVVLRNRSTGYLAKVASDFGLGALEGNVAGAAVKWGPLVARLLIDNAHEAAETGARGADGKAVYVTGARLFTEADAGRLAELDADFKPLEDAALEMLRVGQAAPAEGKSAPTPG